MTLIDRYLRAVRDHLPRAEQDDIVNELSDSLHSRFEDEEEARGRPLQEDEEVALLRAFGHPMAVAARYRNDERTVTFGRRLIGPELFGTYVTVLAINVAITVVIAAIALVAGGSVWPGLGIVVPLGLQFAIVTAIFVVVDARWIRDPDGWDPRTVSSMGPDVDVSTLDGLANQLLGKAHPRAVALTTSILEIALGALVLTVALQVGVPRRLGFMEPGPGWRDLFVPAIGVLVASLGFSLVTLVRPRWARFRVAAHAASYLAAIVIGLVSLSLGSWLVIADPSTASAKETELVATINTVIRWSIAVSVVLAAISAALEIRRLRQLRAEPGGGLPRRR